jgi:uncharacterized membrane protein HdeD (DUF308 family)
MATANPAQGLQGPLRTAKKVTGWYIAAAVLFIVLGMFAIIEPAVAGLGVTLLVGWLLIFGGIAHLVAAFKGGGAKHVILQILIGIVYLIGGLYSLVHPLLAVGTLTLLLAAVIFAGGILEIISYFRLRSEGISGWMLLNGVIAILLGGMIWFHWPSSSVWAIGILVGVNLLFTGITRLMFGLAAQKLVGRAAG